MNPCENGSVQLAIPYLCHGHTNVIAVCTNSWCVGIGCGGQNGPAALGSLICAGLERT